MASGKAHVNGKVLEWARLQAELSPAETVQLAGINAVRDVPAEERLLGWESGSDLPTRNQLAALAKVYSKPTAMFYLPAPPSEGESLPDFRTLLPEQVRMSPRLRSLISKMKARQNEVVSLLEDEEDQELHRIEFIGRFSVNSNFSDVVNDIRHCLGLTERIQRDQRSVEGLLRLIRARAEDLGVFVIIQGDLGNHSTRIEPEEFRGFCLSDPIAPFIVVNSYDAKPAQTFTLLHELAHLWIDESGISNIGIEQDAQPRNNIEIFCNKVASEFLLPRQSLLEYWNELPHHDLYAAVNSIAAEFSVSRRAVAYRLRLESEISFADWRTLSERFFNEYMAARQRLRERDGGPSPYVLKRFSLGRRFIGTVLGALDAGHIGYTSASRMLGVPAKGFSKIRAEA